MKPTVRLSWGLALVLCASFAPSSAGATEPAFVSRLGGYDVTITRGGQAIPVRVQMLIKAGETVTAGPDSFVEVRYLADGCTLRVANGRSVVVGTSSPCAAPKQEEQTRALEPPAKPQAPAAKARPQEEMVARVTGRSGPLTRANFGNGLVELQTGTELKAGNTVFAGQGSTITLYYYKADCQHSVPAENYLEINEDAPCQKAERPNERGSSATASADLGLAIGAAVVVGGGAAAAVLLLSGEEDEDRPATPN